MAFKKAKGGGARPLSKPPSKGRVKSFIQRRDEGEADAGRPSTLPPPPFESETAMEGLAVWLYTHMALASQLLWLEQQADAAEGPPSSGRDGHLVPLRSCVAGAAAVRDALYELYCDAADPRLSLLVLAGAPLEVHVRETYRWCAFVVRLLVRITTDLRTPSGPDWNRAKADFRAAEATYPGSADAVRAGLGGLSIDFTSPVEPLRSLPGDLDALLRATAELRRMLSKRFA